jgi:hypothetical protein
MTPFVKVVVLALLYNFYVWRFLGCIEEFGVSQFGRGLNEIETGALRMHSRSRAQCRPKLCRHVSCAPSSGVRPLGGFAMDPHPRERSARPPGPMRRAHARLHGLDAGPLGHTLSHASAARVAHMHAGPAGQVAHLATPALTASKRTRVLTPNKAAAPSWPPSSAAGHRSRRRRCGTPFPTQTVAPQALLSLP